MIRLAGAKNDGAWFRTNQFIKRFKAEDPAHLALVQNIIAGADGFTEYVDAINSIATYYGVELTAPYTAADFAGAWSDNGIPREVWLGVPRMTVYDKVAIAGTADPVKYRYVDRYASAFRTFAINLRYQMRNWIKAQSFITDVENVQDVHHGNPGGLPDATKGN